VSNNQDKFIGFGDITGAFLIPRCNVILALIDAKCHWKAKLITDPRFLYIFFMF